MRYSAISLFNISIRKSDHEKEDVLNQNKHIRDCHMKGGKVDFKQHQKHAAPKAGKTESGS